MIGYQTLAQFSNPHEYLVLKNLLEQAELRFFFQNETVMSIIPLPGNLFSGIQLRVHPEDFEEASEIFEAFQKNAHLRIR